MAWSYEDPLPESVPIAGMLSFDPARADVRAEIPRDAAAVAACDAECAVPGLPGGGAAAPADGPGAGR